MKIGIISDTHNRLGTITQAFGLLANHSVELVIHCGDWTTADTLAFVADTAAAYGIPLAGVFGNRDDHAALYRANTTLDIPVRIPDRYELLELTLADKRLCVYHGHHKPTLGRLLADPHYDVILTGHSHKPLIQQLDDKLVVNPGSTAFSIPRRREARSLALYNTAKHTAELVYFEPS
ncbi:MAG TPA: YfcE family phosphodiesterase [Candidatus Saccharimonadales bacterium]|nr:YfcE family phosphodiesterase [Candidatus Saccharimonadales bacterium]